LQKRSTCIRVQVSSLIVKDGRIISTGWNGTLKGMPHCNEIFDKYHFDKEEHYKFSKENEIHSEINSLMIACKNGIKVDGCDIYCLVSPCFNCAKAIVASGIKRLFFVELYDRENSIEWLKKVGILVEKI